MSSSENYTELLGYIHTIGIIKDSLQTESYLLLENIELNRL
jgi:hypothetical protein